MPIRLTPTLGLSGLYVLKPPFTVREGVQYKCSSLRTFREAEAQGVSVFETYYEPNGISYETYKEDRQSSAVLVTLSTNGSAVVVPDTYIDALPERIVDPTSLLVISVDLGPLPDSLGLSHVMTEIQAQCAELLGYIPEAKLHRVEHTDPLTPQEQTNIETARLAAVEVRRDVYTRLKEAQDTISRMNDQLQAMEALLLENDLVDPGP